MIVTGRVTPVEPRVEPPLEPPRAPGGEQPGGATGRFTAGITASRNARRSSCYNTTTGVVATAVSQQLLCSMASELSIGGQGGSRGASTESRGGSTVPELVLNSNSTRDSQTVDTLLARGGSDPPRDRVEPTVHAVPHRY